jgi:formylglycine-generating enzyme
MRTLVTSLLWAGAIAGLPVAGACADYVDVPGRAFTSVIASDATGGITRVDAFSMRATPVTNGEFRRFLDAHPQWARGQVPAVFADGTYLSHWPSAGKLSAQDAARPVTHVSWFAAEAFCESEDARLPTWGEWELAAAADAARADARSDVQWRAQILSWYARPATEALPAVGGAPNVFGVRDMHGVVWEWVDDFNALLVDADSRSGSDPDKLKFCGAGAINLQQRQNYAILMRVALLSSLKATDSTATLGFRCARPLNKDLP